MTDTAASLDDVTLFDGRGFAYGDVRALGRGLIGSAAMGIAAVAAVGASAAVVTVAGVWMVGVALSGNSHLQAAQPAGPARLALVDPAAFPNSSFEAKWARTSEALPAAARLAARRAEINVAEAGRDVGTQQPATPAAPHVKHEVARLTLPIPAPARAMPKPTKPVTAAHVAPVPLPRARPAQISVARVPAAEAAVEKASDVAPKIAAKATPQIATLTPPAAKESAVPRETKKAPILPAAGSRTALYDIAGHTVYMPDGTRLEAHSGLGNKIDDPRFIKVKMRGPTPPNVYDLTLREQLFHGVRAIRLNPVNENKMFGRAGMLAHTYMLGPNGQSNGCVSFKDYDKFLRAFLKGKVDRMVVVRNLDETPTHLASLVRVDRAHEYRYAANETSPMDR